MRSRFATLVAAGLMIGACGVARADFVFTPFGPNGEGGFVNGQDLTFGTEGTAFEIDAFLNVAGQDLNGADLGTSRRLSEGPQPGFGLIFGVAQPSPSRLTLNYQISNNTGATLTGVQSLFFINADIDADFTDEFATILGAPISQTFQADDPTFGTIGVNLANGTLSNTNNVPSTSPNDVSLALGFSVGTLLPGESVSALIFLSDSNAFLAGLRLVQQDVVLTDTLIASGSFMIVPEPGALILLGLGSVVMLAGRRVTHGRNRRQPTDSNALRGSASASR